MKEFTAGRLWITVGGQSHASICRFYDVVCDGKCWPPGTSSFVGEFLVIMTAFKANFWVAFLLEQHLY